MYIDMLDDIITSFQPETGSVCFLSLSYFLTGNSRPCTYIMKREGSVIHAFSDQCADAWKKKDKEDEQSHTRQTTVTLRCCSPPSLHPNHRSLFLSPEESHASTFLSTSRGFLSLNPETRAGGEVIVESLALGSEFTPNGSKMWREIKCLPL